MTLIEIGVPQGSIIGHYIHHTPTLTNYMPMLMSRPIIYINGSAQTGCL